MAFTKNSAAPLPFHLVAAATGLALPAVVPVGYRVLDGGVQAAVTGTISELGNGQYLLDGQADDFNADYTVGFLFTAAGAIPAHTLVQMSRFHKGIAYDIPFRLVTIADGSALTGAVVTGYRCIDGAAQGAAGGTFVERGNGQYVYQGVAADFNGDDTVGFLFTAANALPMHIAIDIEPALVVTGNKLRAKIYSILTTDAIINDPSYLGGMLGKTTSTPYGVYYQSPPEKPDAPILTYNIIDSIDHFPRRLSFTFTAWGDNFDNILARVFELLHKKIEIVASDYSFKAMLFDGSGPELFDDDLKVYYRADRYQAIAVKTPQTF